MCVCALKCQMLCMYRICRWHFGVDREIYLQLILQELQGRTFQESKRECSGEGIIVFIGEDTSSFPNEEIIRFLSWDFTYSQEKEKTIQNSANVQLINIVDAIT